MEKSRISVALRLTFLLGLPALVVLGLFGFGVRLGVHNKDRVLGVEHRLFGWGTAPETSTSASESSTTSAPAPGDSGSEAADAGPGEGPGSSTPPLAPDAGDGADAGATAGDSAGGKTPPPTPVESPTSPPDGSVDTPPSEPLPPVASRPTPPDDLVGAMASRRVVTVKVLVDDTTVEAHPDWVDYAQRLLSLSSANFEQLFGIELRLYGVMRWEVSSNPVHADAFLELVKEQPRDGADILLAITDRAMVDGVGGSAERWPDSVERNGAYAVVYASATRREPHLQGAMHELGHLMGANDVDEAEAPGFRGDNFMSYAPHQERLAPVIDEDNLRQVLRRKSWPFVSERD